MAEHEAHRSVAILVIFPFRSNSPLLNRWKINNLQPQKCKKGYWNRCAMLKNY